MYGGLPQLQNLRDLEEQIGEEEEGGFKVILGMTSRKGDEGWSNS